MKENDELLVKLADENKIFVFVSSPQYRHWAHFLCVCASMCFLYYFFSLKEKRLGIIVQFFSFFFFPKYTAPLKPC